MFVVNQCCGSAVSVGLEAILNSHERLRINSDAIRADTSDRGNGAEAPEMMNLPPQS